MQQQRILRNQKIAEWTSYALDKYNKIIKELK